MSGMPRSARGTEIDQSFRLQNFCIPSGSVIPNRDTINSPVAAQTGNGRFFPSNKAFDPRADHCDIVQVMIFADQMIPCCVKTKSF